MASSHNRLPGCPSGVYPQITSRLIRLIIFIYNFIGIYNITLDAWCVASVAPLLNPTTVLFHSRSSYTGWQISGLQMIF